MTKKKEDGMVLVVGSVHEDLLTSIRLAMATVRVNDAVVIAAAKKAGEVPPGYVFLAKHDGHLYFADPATLTIGLDLAGPPPLPVVEPEDPSPQFKTYDKYGIKPWW